MLTVHRYRQKLKNARAALRLIRAGLSDSEYHSLNHRFRDAARLLTQRRDAQVLIETFDKLAGQFHETKKFEEIRKTLLRRRRQVNKHASAERKKLARALQPTAQIDAEVFRSLHSPQGRKILNKGLKHVYRVSRRSYDKARCKSTVESFHEWRKQTKYLWNQMEILESETTQAGKRATKKLHQLSKLLGEDHDFAVLGQALEGDNEIRNRPEARILCAEIDRRRSKLERQSLKIGKKFFRKYPKDIFSIPV